MQTSPNYNSAVFLESLEAKLAPAGTIFLTISGGTLNITGDGGDNIISITDAPSVQGPGTPGAGSWEIRDPAGSGTTFVFHGAILPTPFFIPVQKSIKVNLGDGADRIDIVPSAGASGMMLTGGVTINGGNGDDTVNLTNAGGQHLTIGGATSIDLGEGQDTLNLNSDMVFGGTVKLLAGGGNDTIQLVAGVSHQFQKGLTVDLGTGTDLLDIDSDFLDILGGAFAVKSTGTFFATQTINLNPTVGNIDGAASFAITNGDLNLVLGTGANTLSFGAGLTIAGGGGSDSVSVNASVTVAGALSATFKDGTNTFTLFDDRSLQVGSLSLVGGAGSDTAVFGEDSTLTVGGTLNLALGAGTNLWEIETGQALTTGQLIYKGEGGDDSLSFGGAGFTVLSHATLGLGAGANVVSFASSDGVLIVGNLALTGGAGLDTVTVSTPAFRVLGNLTSNLGDGTNSISTGAAFFHVSGNFDFTGGKGDDTLTSANSSLFIGKLLNFKPGDAISLNLLELGAIQGNVGAVTYKGGTGYDQLLLGDADALTTLRLSINGAVNATLGAGQALVTLTDTFVNGALNVTSAATSAQTDSVSIIQSTVNGAVSLTQGAGNSTLSAQDVLIRGAFTANLGAGADTVALDTLAGSTMKSTWFGLVKVMTGAGADSITLGSNPGVLFAGNDFYRNVSIDGGTDADILTQGNNTFFAGSTLASVAVP